jgi:hypothetical protein
VEASKYRPSSPVINRYASSFQEYLYQREALLSRFKSLICRNCLCSFDYPIKEYNRQTKKVGRKDNEFYCSLSCARIWKNYNEPNIFRDNPEKQKEFNILAQKRRKPKSPFAYFVRHVARKRYSKYGFDIDKEYLEKLWEQQEGKCAISGIPLLIKYFKNKSKPNTASLDRIDSNKGYIKGNVQFVAYSLNLAKNSFSNEEFLTFYNSLS